MIVFMEGQMVLLATRTGFRALTRDRNSWRDELRALDGKNVTALIAREGVILAGTTNGIFRSDDLDKTWREASRGLTARHVRWMAFHPDVSDLEFAGTEPANIFVSHNGAATWRECPEVPRLRDAHRWMLPYSPEAGCVRGFAFHGTRAYAAVEVGGALMSDNSGEAWRLADGSDGSPRFGAPRQSFIHPDVHSINIHPSSPDLVFAPTGGGFYRSNDGGKTWELLYDCYCRATWLDPRDANHLILGPADDVDSNGRIEESHDGGKSWRDASNGLKVPWRKHMVERFTQIGVELYAVLSNGALIVSRIASWEWREVLPSDAGVNAVTAMM
jgi:hypothetical protein